MKEIEIELEEARNTRREGGVQCPEQDHQGCLEPKAADTRMPGLSGTEVPSHTATQPLAAEALPDHDLVMGFQGQQPTPSVSPLPAARDPQVPASDHITTTRLQARAVRAQEGGTQAEGEGLLPLGVSPPQEMKQA